MSFFDELKRRNVFRVGIAYGVAAWVLLQIVDLVLDNVAAPQWVMHVFMLFVVVGFVAAIIIAWAYELTPEGIKREADVDRSQSLTHHTAKKLDAITLAAIAVLIVLLLVDRFTEKGSEPFSQTSEQVEALDEQKRDLTPAVPAPASPTVNEKSIAVLPLVNRSVNPEDAFFADGIHDEILTRLSRIAALKVISRTSVMGYAGTTKRMTEIGQELGVATLLEGGVQRAGNRVRINVQLIEAATDKHLWAEVFDRELTANNLFDIQSEITKAIADALQAVLTGEERRSLAEKPTDNVEAYAHFLRGKAKSVSYGRIPSEIRESIEAYQAAIDLDPNFAAAYAAISTDWMEIFWTSAWLGDERDKAHAALQKAQALAPQAAETLIAEGYYHYWGFLDYEAAIAAFDKALQQTPGSALALRGKAYVLRRMGRLEDSIATMLLAIALDPMDAQMPSDLGYTQVHTGRFKEADEMFRRSMAQNPGNLWNRWSYSEYFMVLNELDKARATLGPVQEDTPAYITAMHFYHAFLDGDRQAMEETLAHWEKVQERPERTTIARGLALFTEGKIDSFRAALKASEQKLLAADRQNTGQAFTLSSMIMLYALQGNTANLDATIERFNSELKPDAMRLIEDRSILNAYAMMGDADRAFDYADTMAEAFGPWELYYIVIDPLFDGLRDHPRYKALAQQYQQWLETVQ